MKIDLNRREAEIVIDLLEATGIPENLMTAAYLREQFGMCTALIVTKQPQPQPSAWQPIETAPKDERIIVGPTKRMGICVAMHDDRDGWVTETPSEWVNIHAPAHWMPLPAPPETA